MIDQIRSEWLKIRSVRSYWIMVSLAVLLAGAVGAIAGKDMAGATGMEAVILAMASIPPFFMFVIGVQVISQEYRFSTIRTTLAVTPKRGRVVAAKAIMVALFALGCAAAFFAAALLGVAIFGNVAIHFGAAGIAGQVAGAFAYVVLLAEFGLALGMILRQPTAAIAIGLIWITAIEQLLSSVLPKTARWLPLQAANGLVSTSTDSDHFSRLAGGLYATAVIAGLLVIGNELVRRRDA